VTAAAVLRMVFFQLPGALLRGAGCGQFKPEQRAFGRLRDFLPAREVVPADFRNRGIEARPQRVRCNPVVPSTLTQALRPGRRRLTSPVVEDTQPHHRARQ